jgi:5'-nucleotidase
MAVILVTNDDGVHSAGIHALARGLASLGEITIVAPLGDTSAIGHALTLTRPLRLEQIGENVYAVDGTPTDCVNLGIEKVLGMKPALVVSGINTGYNLGDDVTYSGTVAAALEATLLGIPGIAVSLHRSREYDFTQAAWAAGVVARHVLTHGLAPRTFLNVNVPRDPARGFKVTVQTTRQQATAIREGVDPRGRKYYWVDEVVSEWALHPRSDVLAVTDGWISVTPLQTDLTSHAALATLDGVDWPVPAAIADTPAAS